MGKKIYTSPDENSHSSQWPEPHHTIQQALLEEDFSAEIALLQNLKMMPRPKAVEDLLNKINRKALEEHL